MSFWSRLSGAQKQTVIILGLVSGAGLVVTGTYMAGKPPKPADVAYRAPMETIELGPEQAKILKKTEKNDLQQELKKKDEELKAVVDKNEKAMQDADAVWKSKVQAAATLSAPLPKAEAKADVKTEAPREIPVSNFQPPVPRANTALPYPPVPQKQGQPPSPPSPPSILKGGIGVLGGLNGGKKDVPAKDAKGNDIKKKKKIRIPTGSFMDAMILTGVYAPTTKDGRSDSAPILFRVSTPAQLPNEVKTSLKGCFALGNAIGALKDERVHVEILRLSCVSKNQRALIDQAIVAYVADSADGMEGVRGEVVAKLEKPLLRTVVAGFFKGVGDMVKASSSTTSISSLGQTSTVDPGKVAAGGLGSAVSSAADKLQEFYLHLAEMSMPVVGVKAGREVSLILRQGVDLDLQELCEGDDECAE